VRWQHPERGLVSPAEFIELAEETGLIIPLGEWVLRESCHQLQTWQQQHGAAPSMTINVNLSAKQFTVQALTAKISEILHDTGLPASCLKLEITESIIMASAEHINDTLLQLRKLGIEACLDDFGTGYSSFSYLHQFAFHTLKIDRSFLNHMEQGEEKVEIVRAIITLAHNLNMRVVAEGIETAAQLVQLQKLGCDLGQGYFFSKPVGGETATDMVTHTFSLPTHSL
jgi:EAL domain-containing protein (putative c-di-GMP-specific phosphodiesterase class I)